MRKISEKVDIYIYIYIYRERERERAIIIMVTVFANYPGDRSLIPGRVIPKNQKMVLDTSLLNTHHYKIQI